MGIKQKMLTYLWVFGLVAALVFSYVWAFSGKRTGSRRQTPINKNPGETTAVDLMKQYKSIEVPLVKRIQISHDTYIFQYGLPKEEMRLGLFAGEHIAIQETVKTPEEPEGEVIYRKYTPVSGLDERGSFDLLVKIYRPNTHPKFPEGGMLTPLLEKMQIGDKIRITGPYRKFNYLGNGHVKIFKEGQHVDRNFKHIAMVAGGTGITPMYQIIKKVADSQDDQTQLYLLFANKTPDDILLREELESFAARGKLKLFYTLDTSPGDFWKGYVGFVSQEMILKSFPKPSNEVLVLTCGPGPMNKLTLGLYEKLGYNPEYTFKF
eukprot:TRINITY_DN777_c0_g1_i9.p1 TRINITY_DN777_c0_g1~~TRINITY_DN777_c0_g1_i9.p1  ORF type:complete len:321 (+),score=51.26 TRINITY_DN777_c0_g1_i9:105-1067(+)